MNLNVLVSKGVVLLFTLTLFSQCSLYTHGWLSEEYDGVKAEKRYRLTLSHNYWLERGNVFQGVEHTIIKEIFSDSTAYTFYDELQLQQGSYTLSDSIYFIIDKKIYPIKPTKNGSTHREQFKTNTDQDEVRINRTSFMYLQISYPVSESLMGLLANADSASFRYYIGPDMVTIPLSRFSIRSLNKMVNVE
jgi:hypothetical protein